MKRAILLISIFLCCVIGGFAQEVTNTGNATNSNFGGIANVTIDISSKYMVSILSYTEKLMPKNGKNIYENRKV